MSGATPARVGSLVQFFHFDEKGEKTVQNGLEALASSSASVMVRGAFAAVGAVAPDFIAASLASTLKLVLDTPLKGIFVGAWNLRRDLQKFRNQKEYPPEETFDYDLKSNEIGYAYKPGIQLVIGGLPVEPIVKFEISAKLTNTPKLKIRNAHIIGADLGSVEGRGAISCEGAVLLNRPVGEFAVTDSNLWFGSGLAIGSPRTG